MSVALLSCRDKKILFSSDERIKLQNEKSDTIVNELLKPFKEKLNSEMNEFLVYNEEPMVKGQPESNLGNFVSDCVMEKAKQYYSSMGINVDFVILNNGGLRTALPSGKLTKGNIFELMPFENEMVLTYASGKKVLLLADYIAEKGGVPVSGLKMIIDKNKNSNEVYISNIPIDTNKIYSVVSSDYLIQGGDNITFFKEEKKVFSGLLIRDIIIEYCRNYSKTNKTIKVKIDGRISISR